MEIKQLKTSELIPYARNAKEHPEWQIQQIAASIKEFGFNDPIAIDKDNVIIEGHGRLLAAQLLDITEVPTICLDHMTKRQQRAYILAHNKLTMNTGFDLEMLNYELEDIGNDFDIGFTTEELDEIGSMFNDDVEGHTEDDAAPEVSEGDPRISRGDIIQLGNHRLMCGDSTDRKDVDALMNGEKADMVFTDPPYGVSYQGNMRTKSKKFDVIKNDDKFISGWIDFINDVSTGFVFVWTSFKVVSKWIDICSRIGEQTNMIIWDKGGGGMGDLTGSFSTDFEISLVYNRGSKIRGKRIGSVWSVGKDASSKYVHPTQKPVELAETAVAHCSDNGNKILDLFLGSGSTLIACEKTNRKCYGMELDEKYCDVIVTRWCNYTGKNEIKINGESVKWGLRNGEQ